MTGSPHLLLFSESSEPGGAETVVLRLAEQLSKSRDVVVLSMKDGWLNQELSRRGIECRCLESHSAFDVAFLQRLTQQIRRQNIQLIHSHLPDSNAYAALAGALTSVPVIATYHNMLDALRPLSRRDRLKLRLVRWRARRVVVVSESMREEFLTRARFSPTKVTTIYNGIAWDELESPVDRDQARAELGLEAQVKLVGMLGALRPVKGHVHAFRALKQVHATRTDVRLLIAGEEDPVYKSQLVKELETLGIAHAVTFLGFRSDVGRLLRAMDVFIMPSLSEGHPLATVEAMGMGVPVVVTAVGGHTEMVVDGHSGYLVPPGDAATLADRLLGVLAQPDKARDMAAQARAYARERFSLAHMVQQYESLYNECLGGV